MEHDEAKQRADWENPANSLSPIILSPLDRISPPSMKQTADAEYGVPVGHHPNTPWSVHEIKAFVFANKVIGKRFDSISLFIGTKSFQECADFYHHRFKHSDAYMWSITPTEILQHLSQKIVLETPDGATSLDSDKAAEICRVFEQFLEGGRTDSEFLQDLRSLLPDDQLSTIFPAELGNLQRMCRPTASRVRKRPLATRAGIKIFPRQNDRDLPLQEPPICTDRGGIQTCANCHTDTTSLWRPDKDSGIIYCNACGIYAKTHNGASRPKRLWIKDEARVQQHVRNVQQPPARVESCYNPQNSSSEEERSWQFRFSGADSGENSCRTNTSLEVSSHQARKSRNCRSQYRKLRVSLANDRDYQLEPREEFVSLRTIAVQTDLLVWADDYNASQLLTCYGHPEERCELDEEQIVFAEVLRSLKRCRVEPEDVSWPITYKHFMYSAPDTAPDGETRDPGRTCANCGTKETSLWRKEKGTERIVCNACGLYARTKGKARDPSRQINKERRLSKGPHLAADDTLRVSEEDIGALEDSRQAVQLRQPSYAQAFSGLADVLPKSGKEPSCQIQVNAR
eukprot:jgi/Botrbrau1/16011/Bobra.0353s0009.1